VPRHAAVPPEHIARGYVHPTDVPSYAAELAARAKDAGAGGGVDGEFDVDGGDDASATVRTV
jgi:hypothetical protein